jgi:hypothetical protein
MKGSVLSRWSRYARILPPTALVLGSLAVLPSCAGKAGETASAPAPKDTPAPKETASAEPKKPANTPAQPKPVETAQQPKPADTVAAAPAAIDSTAVAADFCKKITDGVQAAIKADSSLADPDAAVRKVTGAIPDQTISVALAKNTTCR